MGYEEGGWFFLGVGEREEPCEYCIERYGCCLWALVNKVPFLVLLGWDTHHTDLEVIHNVHLFYSHSLPGATRAALKNTQANVSFCPFFNILQCRFGCGNVGNIYCPGVDMHVCSR